MTNSELPISMPELATIFSSQPSPASSPNGVPNRESPLSGTRLEFLPYHIQELLIKGNISRSPCCLSPYRCVLTRHPIHRDAVDSHISSLIYSIKDHGFDNSLAAAYPLIAIRYTKPIALPNRSAGNTKTMVQPSWGDHPLVYVMSGAGRGEAIGHLLQKEPDHLNVKPHQKGLGFYLINSGENLTPWEVFLLSTALNALDPNSRPPNYFERTDQIAFICWELSNRKGADATFREIAVEICFNPFLTELRDHLKLNKSVCPLLPIVESLHSKETLQQLIQNRRMFSYLPAGMSVICDRIPFQPLESLDILIDMATCVNSDRMKKAVDRKKENITTTTTTTTQAAKTEGLLHPRAEDQLRSLFKEIVPLDSASNFDVMAIRDLVSIVFGAIQECSRLFRRPTVTNREQDFLKLQHETLLATSKLAAAYWIERIVYEAGGDGLLAGLWNFPAAALVTLFYIYFINRIQTFERKLIETNILELGTVLYRCVAELALTLRSSKIVFNNNSPPHIQIRVLEGISLLFRMALFKKVTVEVFPPHPYKITTDSVSCQKKTLEFETKTFDNVDHLYQFLYTHWFAELIPKRLPPSPDYKESTNQKTTIPADVLPPAPRNMARKKSWVESRRADVTATANRLRQEVELAVNQPAAIVPGQERVRVRRAAKRPGNNDSQQKLADSIEVEILDPSILPMAQPARLEFLSLVFGVTAMLIEKQQCIESVPSAKSLNQILSVPANMIVLAAIKVALSFIPPHFDKLAPNLVHWIDARTRLILWMWKSCKQELCRRAEQKWNEIASQKTGGGGGLHTTFEVKFTGSKFDGKMQTELNLPKLGEVVNEILPGVLHSMTQFYELHSELSDDKIIREFFAHWLKSAGDGDLIAQVNALLSKPSTSNSLLQDNAAKRPRHSRDILPRDYLRMPPSPLPPGIATGHPAAGESNNNRQSPSLGPLYMKPSIDERAAKRPRRPGGRGGDKDGYDELADWLESLPYTERIRLESLQVPSWELVKASDVSLPDLLRWRPPEVTHPFIGNGLKGPAVDTHELKMLENSSPGRNAIPSLSDIDWKVTRGVLKLLKSRGIDTLMSRRRGQVFFLDRMSDMYKERSDQIMSDGDGEQPNDRNKKRQTKKNQNDVFSQKRYGSTLLKVNDISTLRPHRELELKIPDLEEVRSFLEQTDLTSSVHYFSS